MFVDKSAEFAYVYLNPESFKRTISNLINNAVESINDDGQVAVSLQRKINSIVLEINDTGSGIPDHILKNIKEKRKIQNGNGLGLPYALKSIKEWGAAYEISAGKEKVLLFRLYSQFKILQIGFKNKYTFMMILI